MARRQSPQASQRDSAELKASRKDKKVKFLSVFGDALDPQQAKQDADSAAESPPLSLSNAAISAQAEKLSVCGDARLNKMRSKMLTLLHSLLLSRHLTMQSLPSLKVVDLRRCPDPQPKAKQDAESATVLQDNFKLSEATG